MERDARLKYGEAISKLESIRGWRDADKKIQECSDRLAKIERKREEQRIADEKADKERRIAAQKAAEKRKRILSIAIPAIIAVFAIILVVTKIIIPGAEQRSEYNTVGLKSDGTVVAAGDNKYGRCDVSNWTNIKLPNSKK